MAHKKAAGSAKNLRDSNPKYRGVKLFGGQTARAGNIIIRQKGDVFHLGKHVYKGRDYTIHAAVDGIVQFRKKNVKKYNGRVYLETTVDILPLGGEPMPVLPVKKTKKAPAAKKIIAAPKKTETKKESTTLKKAAPKQAKTPAAKKSVTTKKTEKAAPKAKAVAAPKVAKKAAVKTATKKASAAKKPAPKKPAAAKKPAAKKSSKPKK